MKLFQDKTIFHAIFFVLSSGYLRGIFGDKTKGKFMYQRNDRLGGTFRVQSYKKQMRYANNLVQNV